MERPQQKPVLVMGGAPKTYEYKPQEDITPWELSHLVVFLLSLMTGSDPDGAYARLPEVSRRHIIILE